nr:hypothetical protein [Klebsiella pneumoniae]
FCWRTRGPARSNPRRTLFPYREDDYVRRPPDWGKRLEVSCSS